ncbi:hypothetical protein L484_018956 [Morus notabilis]|uniref:Uncharacterized protein n=1 Tax=Morus notabilis TaxID=981085 RepID=W9RJX1_9ROSA|nr:hypothetical protein L484_018956 [Morus notabilis]
MHVFYEATCNCIPPLCLLFLLLISRLLVGIWRSTLSYCHQCIFFLYFQNEAMYIVILEAKAMYFQNTSFLTLLA